MSPMPSGYEPAHQLVLPYFGLFAYSVGRQKWLLDPNRVLFISPGWEFRDDQPVPGLGHATVIINPDHSLVDEMRGSGGRIKKAFPSGTVRSSASLQLMTQALLGHSMAAADSLRGDELAVKAMKLAIGGKPARERPSARTVDRAKQYLHAHDCERLCLEEIANAVDVSPVYLTQEFKRSEGIPLYQYQLSLRLTRALVELPHSNDITLLALDMGFSSHSHFTFAFRKAFGVTPSAYRRSASRAASGYAFSRVLTATRWAA
jgi:AraC-like DNA-binding protein